VLVALLLPLVLLPVAAYAVEGGYLAARQSELQWACARAVEDAAQQIDQQALRQSSTLQIDPSAAALTGSRTLKAVDPQASVGSYAIGATAVSATVTESVPSTLAFWLPRRIQVSATCAARLEPGYASPSS
jgi:hypothetical protein